MKRTMRSATKSVALSLLFLLSHSAFAATDVIKNAICWAWTNKCNAVPSDTFSFGATFFDREFKEIAFVEHKAITLQPFTWHLSDTALSSLNLQRIFEGNYAFMLYSPTASEADELSKQHNAMLDKDAFKTHRIITNATDFEYPCFFTCGPIDVYISGLAINTTESVRNPGKLLKTLHYCNASSNVHFGPKFCDFGGELASAKGSISGLSGQSYVAVNQQFMRTVIEHENGEGIKLYTGYVCPKKAVLFTFDKAQLAHIKNYLKGCLDQGAIKNQK